MTTTIEKTGKRWKFLAVFGWIVIFAAFFVWIVSAEDVGPLPALLVFTFGALLRLIAQLGKWWNHS